MFAAAEIPGPYHSEDGIMRQALSGSRILDFLAFADILAVIG